MNILIFSDSHGDTKAINKAISENSNITNVIFLGDGLKDIDKVEQEHLDMRFYKVCGNCDYDPFAASEALSPFGGVLVMFTHGHLYNVKSSVFALANAAKAKHAQVALFGHTHMPFNEEVSGILLFNPGSISTTKVGKATYGIMHINDGKIEFEHKILGA